MENDEAIALLNRGLNTDSSEKALLASLARRMGNWPLILNLANRSLRTSILRNSSLQEAIVHIENRWKQKKIAALNPKDQKNIDEAIYLALESSLETLPENIKMRFFELGIFPAENEIPLYVLQQLWDLDGSNVTFIVEYFANASLVDYNMGSGSISMHEVLRLYALETTHLSSKTT